MTSFLTPVEFHSGFSHSFLAQRGSSNTTATFLDSAPNTHSFRFIPRCRRARSAFTIIIDIIIAFLDAPQYSTEHTMRQCDIHIYIETVVPIFIISFCALALPNSLRCCSIGGRRRRRPFVSIYHLYFIAFSYYYYDDRAHRIFECGRMAANSRRLFLVVSIGVAPVIPCSNFLLKLCRRRVWDAQRTPLNDSLCVLNNERHSPGASSARSGFCARLKYRSPNTQCILT